MAVISDMITKQKSDLQACHNDGLGQGPTFMEEGKTTNRTIPVEDFLQDGDIANVVDSDKHESSKQCLAASASLTNEDASFNTVKDDASIVK
jgi:hypothetical protein